jgi:Uma2 family endonuclease
MAAGGMRMRAASRKTTRPRHATVAEYLTMPADGLRTDLIYGEIVVAAQPSDKHQDWLHCLGEILRRWVRRYRLGKVCFDIDMILDVDNNLVYNPDLLFLARENENRLREGRLHGPADLAIEILSPSDRPSVRGRKYADYERYGIPWYWTIQPEADQPILEENQLVDGKYVCRAEVVGNAWFTPAIFPGLFLRLPPILEGDLKAAVKGKAKPLM